MRSLVLSIGIALLVTACAVGPDYVRPEIDSPEQWRVEYEAAADVANIAWWEQFDDPALNELIGTALKENNDLKIATARVEAFIGRLQTVRADFFPQIGAEGFASRQRASENTYPQLSTGQSTTFNNYQADLFANWEIDLWGRIRRSSEAARAELIASEEGKRGIILSLVSAVANSYVTLRSLDKQLEISQKTADTYGKTVDLFRLRFEAGTVSMVEVSQIESQYYLALQSIQVYEQLIAQQENLISILLGRNPGPVPRGKSIDELSLPAIPGGLPSNLLDQRPDLRQAEQFLIAANARIGVAKSLYFPTLSLTGLFGGASEDLSDLFKSSSRIWSIGADALVPVFTFGKIGGQVKQAEALQREALYGYVSAVQSAFREVNDALVATEKGRVRLKEQGKQVEALQTYARLAWLRFEAGTTSYLEVLDAERSLFDAELSYGQRQADVFTSLVNTYKAMGGGWVSEAEGMTMTQSESPGQP